MFKNMTLGQYLPGDSFLHRLDARTKLLATLVYIVLIFLVQSYWGYGAVVLFLLACALAGRIRPGFLLRSLRPMLFILLFTMVINLLFTTGETVYWKWWVFTVSREGIHTAVFMAIRLALLILGSQLLTLTTPPLALTDAIETLLRPLARIKLPVHELAMMMTIAMRFIPTLMEETDRLMKAQASRGADFDTGGLMQRAKGMIPLLVPLFISAFRRADELAMAMEARCYHGGEGRTRLKELHFTRADLYAALAVVAFAALLIADRLVFV